MNKLLICILFCIVFLSTEAQNNFADTLRHMIGRSIDKTFKYNEFSDLVFIDYDITKKQLTVKAATKNIYTKTIDELLVNNKRIVKFVKDSAKASFLLPIYFWVDHDEKDWKWDMDAVLLSRFSILNFLSVLKDTEKTRKEVFTVLTLGHNFGGRKE